MATAQNNALTVPRPLHPYFTLNLDREISWEKAKAAGYGFVTITLGVAIVAASFFLFSAVEASTIVFYVSLVAFVAIPILDYTNKQRNLHLALKDFLVEVKECKAVYVDSDDTFSNLAGAATHQDLTPDNQRSIMARYSIIWKRAHQQIGKIKKSLEDFETAKTHKYGILHDLHDFILLKAELKNTLRKLDFVRHLITSPYDQRTWDQFDCAYRQHKSFHQEVITLSNRFSHLL
ncbi:MAG TPA: hypothetical protein VLF61_01715 [Rhabdochlamydiaceae bacterium]|nr:hypothetical protein [Rhabdochlamydiaceae bacterium]